MEIATDDFHGLSSASAKDNLSAFCPNTLLDSIPTISNDSLKLIRVSSIMIHPAIIPFGRKIYLLCRTSIIKINHITSPESEQAARVKQAQPECLKQTMTHSKF